MSRASEARSSTGHLGVSTPSGLNGLNDHQHSLSPVITGNVRYSINFGQVMMGRFP